MTHTQTLLSISSYTSSLIHHSLMSPFYASYDLSLVTDGESTSATPIATSPTPTSTATDLQSRISQFRWYMWDCRVGLCIWGFILPSVPLPSYLSVIPHPFLTSTMYHPWHIYTWRTCSYSAWAGKSVIQTVHNATAADKLQTLAMLCVLFLGKEFTYPSYNSSSDVNWT